MCRGLVPGTLRIREPSVIQVPLMQWYMVCTDTVQFFPTRSITVRWLTLPKTILRQ